MLDHPSKDRHTISSFSSVAHFAYSFSYTRGRNLFAISFLVGGGYPGFNFPFHKTEDVLPI